MLLGVLMFLGVASLTHYNLKPQPCPSCRGSRWGSAPLSPVIAAFVDHSATGRHAARPPGSPSPALSSRPPHRLRHAGSATASVRWRLMVGASLLPLACRRRARGGHAAGGFPALPTPPEAGAARALRGGLVARRGRPGRAPGWPRSRPRWRPTPERPRGLLTAIQVAADRRRRVPGRGPAAHRRWLDAPRARSSSRSRSARADRLRRVGDGGSAFVVVRSVLLDHDLDLFNDYAGLGRRWRSRRAAVPPAISRSGLLRCDAAVRLAHLGTRLAAALGADVSADGFAVPPTVPRSTAGTYVYGVIAPPRIGAAPARGRRPRSWPCSRSGWPRLAARLYMTANPAMAHGASRVRIECVRGSLAARLRDQDAASGRAWSAGRSCSAAS